MTMGGIKVLKMPSWQRKRAWFGELPALGSASTIHQLNHGVASGTPQKMKLETYSL